VTRTVIGGKIEHLPPLHPDFRGLRQVRAAATTQARLMPQPLVRFVDQRQRRPWMSRLPARLAAALRRSDLGAGLVNGESDDGGGLFRRALTVCAE
jgi:hypothetical protein